MFATQLVRFLHVLGFLHLIDGRTTKQLEHPSHHLPAGLFLHIPFLSALQPRQVHVLRPSLKKTKDRTSAHAWQVDVREAGKHDLVTLSGGQNKPLGCSHLPALAQV